MSNKNKYLAVESIRGVACFMVILSHLSLTFFPYLHGFEAIADPDANFIQYLIYHSPFAFFYSGTSAVYIFFVLSGFILTKVALKSENITNKVTSMALKRYPRLMLPALFSCLLAYGLFELFDLSHPMLTHWINNYGDFDYSLGGAIYNGTIDVFFLAGKSDYNPVLWTMKTELIGSFVIYLLCLNRGTFKIPYFIVFVFGAILGCVALKLLTPALALGLISFLGGYLFCLYGKSLTNFQSTLCVLLGLYLAGAHASSLSYQFLTDILGSTIYSLGNFISGFFIVYAILFNERLNAIFSFKLFVFLGKVSFSVYLIHIPIISTFSVFFFGLLYSLTELYVVSALLTSIASILFIYAASVPFYNMVDVKGMKVSHVIAHNIMSLLGKNKSKQMKENSVN